MLAGIFLSWKTNCYVLVEYVCILVCLQNAVCSGSDCRSRGFKFESQHGHITCVEIDHEIISMTSFPFPWFQKGQLTGNSAQVLVNRLEDKACVA